MSILIIIISSLWVGLIIGVSFIATPVKFKAKTLKLYSAVDVGRHTFLMFNKVELIVFIAMIIVMFLGTALAFLYMLTLVLFAILIAQKFWLLPELVVRAEAVINGNPKPKSIHHISYAIFELMKLLILLFMIIKTSNLLI